MGRDLLCLLVVVLLCWCEGGAGQPTGFASDPATVTSFLKYLQRCSDPRGEAGAHEKGECAKIGGLHFPSGGQCLKLFRHDINFEPARAMCRQAGGDMWRPDLSDPDLVKNLATQVPVILTASNEDFWVGLTTNHGRLFDLNGLDVTDTYFGVLSDVNNGGVADGGCVILDFKDGNPRFEAKGCGGGNKTDFLCEFPVSKGK